MIFKAGTVKYEKPKGLKKAFYKVYLVCKTNHIEIYNNEESYHNNGKFQVIPIHKINYMFILGNILHLNINESIDTNQNFNNVKKIKLDDINELNDWKNKINQAIELFDEIENNVSDDFNDYDGFEQEEQ